MQPILGSTELALLGWSVLLVLLQVVLQASLASLEAGLPYALSARDDGRQPQGVLAGRAARALRNLLETYPLFVALALALIATGKTGGAGAIGAQVWFWARVLYIPVYLAGIPVVRTLVWAASIVGLLLMLYALWR